MRRLAVVLAVVLAVLLLTAGLGAQNDRALILGRVIEAGSGEPIRGAIVRISSENAGHQVAGVITDNDGQFVFSGLSAGAYLISATKSGHQAGAFGQRRPGWAEPDPQPLTLHDNERLGDVTLRLWKYGAISGTVLDERGDPVAGVTVRANRRIFLAGRPKLTDDLPTETDDRGIYRISGLVAGEYVLGIAQDSRTAPVALVDTLAQLRGTGDRKQAMELMSTLGAGGDAAPGESAGRRIGTSIFSTNQPVVVSPADQLLVYATQFFPGTASTANARAVSLQPGQDVTGIDFTLRPVRTYKVSGQLIGDTGPMARMTVTLRSPLSAEFEMEMMAPGNSTVSDDQGRFTFLGITPGDYTVNVLKGSGGGDAEYMESPTGVTASQDGVTLHPGTGLTLIGTPGPSRQPTFIATAPVVVGDADVTGLAVTVRNGVRLSGRVDFAAGRNAPAAEALTQLRFVAESRDGHNEGYGEFQLTGKLAADGTFETVELPPGSYFLRARQPPEGWTLDSIAMNGRDISDLPIEVADRPIDGIVIRFTDKPSTLSGSVRPATSADRIDDAIVLVFPVDRAAWVDFGRNPRRLQRAVVTRDGTFEMRGLPGGEYFVTAIHDDFLSDWWNPASLEAASRVATRVSVTSGSAKALDLQVRAAR